MLETKRFPGGTKRVVHVVAKMLQQNFATGQHRPMVGIRNKNALGKFVLTHHASILGPSQLLHTPQSPLPGTDGRAICVLHTEAPIVASFDPTMCDGGHDWTPRPAISQPVAPATTKVPLIEWAFTELGRRGLCVTAQNIEKLLAENGVKPPVVELPIGGAAQ